MTTTSDEVLTLLRELHEMVAAIHREIVPSYPGSDSFGQCREGEELTMRAGLAKGLNR